MSLLNILPLAGSAISAQSQRLNTVASNLANADTVAGPDGRPYQARQVIFQATPIADGRGARVVSTRPGESTLAGVTVSNVIEDSTPGKRTYEPQHPSADDDGYVTRSNVNVVEEMVNMISASRSYQNNIEIMNTAQQLATKTLQLGQ